MPTATPSSPQAVSKKSRRFVAISACIALIASIVYLVSRQHHSVPEVSTTQEPAHESRSLSGSASLPPERTAADRGGNLASFLVIDADSRHPIAEAVLRRRNATVATTDGLGRAAIQLQADDHDVALVCTAPSYSPLVATYVRSEIVGTQTVLEMRPGCELALSFRDYDGAQPIIAVLVPAALDDGLLVRRWQSLVQAGIADWPRAVDLQSVIPKHFGPDGAFDAVAWRQTVPAGGSSLIWRNLPPGEYRWVLESGPAMRLSPPNERLDEYRPSRINDGIDLVLSGIVRMEAGERQQLTAQCFCQTALRFQLAALTPFASTPEVLVSTLRRLRFRNHIVRSWDRVFAGKVPTGVLELDGIRPGDYRLTATWREPDESVSIVARRFQVPANEQVDLGELQPTGPDRVLVVRYVNGDVTVEAPVARQKLQLTSSTTLLNISVSASQPTVIHGLAAGKYSVAGKGSHVLARPVEITLTATPSTKTIVELPVKVSPAVSSMVEVVVRLTDAVEQQTYTVAIRNRVTGDVESQSVRGGRAADFAVVPGEYDMIAVPKETDPEVPVVSHRFVSSFSVGSSRLEVACQSEEAAEIRLQMESPTRALAHRFSVPGWGSDLWSVRGRSAALLRGAPLDVVVVSKLRGEWTPLEVVKQNGAYVAAVPK